MLSNPADLWNTSAAFPYFERKYRYIASRWGYPETININIALLYLTAWNYATNMFAWELWNEIEDVDGYTIAGAKPFIAKSYNSLRSYDPYSHLISLSYGFPGDVPIFDLVDFTMVWKFPLFYKSLII